MDAPDLVVDSGIKVDHVPIAEFGKAVSLGIDCRKIDDEDYQYAKEYVNLDGHLFNEEGKDIEVNKTEYFVKDRIGKIQKYIKENEKTQVDTDWWGQDLRWSKVRGEREWEK